MRRVRSDTLLRIFITVPHLEEGFLDHSNRRRRRSGTVVASRRRVDVAEAASVARTSRASSGAGVGGGPEQRRVMTWPVWRGADGTEESWDG